MSGSKWSVCSVFLRPARCSDQALRPDPWAAFALITLLASCQPLPHPFAEDRPPAELLAVPESVGVSIAPVKGQPTAVAAKLGAATARALLGVDPPTVEPQKRPDITPDTPRVLPCPCPHCGAGMIVIEVFARGCEPRWRPTPSRIDTS